MAQAVEEYRNMPWKHFLFLSSEGADRMDMVLPQGVEVMLGAGRELGRTGPEFTLQAYQGALETWRLGGCAITLTRTGQMGEVIQVGGIPWLP